MKKFEYKIIHMGQLPVGESEKEAFLNMLGSQGWELVQCVNQTALHYTMPDGSETNQFWNGQKSRLLR